MNKLSYRELLIVDSAVLGGNEVRPLFVVVVELHQTDSAVTVHDVVIFGCVLDLLGEQRAFALAAERDALIRTEDRGLDVAEDVELELCILVTAELAAGIDGLCPVLDGFGSLFAVERDGDGSQTGGGVA